MKERKQAASAGATTGEPVGARISLVLRKKLELKQAERGDQHLADTIRAAIEAFVEDAAAVGAAR